MWSVTVLAGLRLHRDPTDHPSVHLLQMEVQARRKVHAYRVSVWFEVEVVPALSLPRVVKVLRAICEPGSSHTDPCPASAFRQDETYAYCTHISALLQVIPNMTRPPDVSGETVCTNSRCAWTEPSGGARYPKCTPIERMVPFKLKYDGMKRSAAGSIRDEAPTDRNPCANPHLLHQRGHPARVAARDAFCDALARSFESRTRSSTK